MTTELSSLFECPPEILTNILVFADPLSLANLALCSTIGHGFANNNLVWKLKLFADFGELLPIPKQFEEKHKEYYIWLFQNQLWTLNETNTRFDQSYEDLFYTYEKTTQTTFVRECCRQRLTDRLTKKELIFCVFIKYYQKNKNIEVIQSLVEWDVPMIALFGQMATENPEIDIYCMLLSFCALSYTDLNDILFDH